MLIQEIIARSNDSELCSLRTENGIVEIVFVNLDINKKINLSFRSEFFYSNFKGGSNTFFIELVELKNVLQIKNGVYVAAEDFGEFMYETRQFYSLAYGLRVSRSKYLFLLTGSFSFASILGDVDSIEIEAFDC